MVNQYVWLPSVLLSLEICPSNKIMLGFGGRQRRVDVENIWSLSHLLPSEASSYGSLIYFHRKIWLMFSFSSCHLRTRSLSPIISCTNMIHFCYSTSNWSNDCRHMVTLSEIRSGRTSPSLYPHHSLSHPRRTLIRFLALPAGLTSQPKEYPGRGRGVLVPAPRLFGDKN